MAFMTPRRLVLAVLALAALVGVYGCASLGAGPTPPPNQWACGGPESYGPAAAVNRATIETLPLSPFGRPEQGWAIYAPVIAAEAHAACPPDTPGFAAAVAFWQAQHRLTAHGAVDAPTFAAMKAVWQGRRPFIALRDRGVCPDPPAEATLAAIPPGDVDKPAVVLLRPRALSALLRMVAAARAAVPEAADDPDRLKVFSGYRSPAYDDARCEAQANCGGLARAACSSHRTGLAVDLDLGFAPGYAVDSSADQNRLFQTRTATYRWLVRNARRYGFVNYVFEPWHWEWTGEPP
jgi:hypothetical protein